MSHLPRTLTALSRLFQYPDEHTAECAELLFVVLQDEVPEAAASLSRFGAFLEQHDPVEVEELYTSTFDVNPVCAAEVGWHLFGEEYARGLFLVRLRQELRKYGIPESHELPDHLTHVLSVLAAMPAEEATHFVKACVQPAVEKMKAAIQGKQSAYAEVVLSLSAVLGHFWGVPASTIETNSEKQGDIGSDLLRDYPVDHKMVECCSENAEPFDLVQLDLGGLGRHGDASQSARARQLLGEEQS